MNARERWNNVFHYKPVDRVFNWEFGYWEENYALWQAAGMPKEVKDEGSANKFFKFDFKDSAGINVGMSAGFEEKVLEETDTYRIVINWEGATLKEFKDGTSSIPHYMDFALKDRASWEKDFKWKLQPDLKKRYPEDWDAKVKEWENRDYPLILNLGSLLGQPRDWMGFEGFAMMFYDDPGLLEEIVKTKADLVIATVEKALKEVKFDGADYWEDIAFNHGPIMSPEMFKKIAVPHYKRISQLLHKYGLDTIYLDCDGDINPIAGMWLDAGVNVMFPIEVHGGTDPVVLRKKYGKDMKLMGGVNKRELAKGKDAIDAELKKLKPLVEEGGYIPHCDHRCPPDVSYENYLYYLKQKKEVFGIKDWDLEPILKTLKK